MYKSREDICCINPHILEKKSPQPPNCKTKKCKGHPPIFMRHKYVLIIVKISLSVHQIWSVL